MKLISMHERVNRLFEDVLATEELRGWSPPADMYETEDAYFIVIEVPGVSEEALSVTLEGNTLLIKGSKEPEERTCEYFQVERHHGLFFRNFSLPEGVNKEEISASLINGLLKIRISKK